MDSYLTELYKKQISLTEWYEAIGHPQTAALRDEDAHKHERLDVLNKVIDLPFGKPARFSGGAVRDRSSELKEYVKTHGDELCAIRLIPKKEGVPKLRMRGYSVSGALGWFDEQKINAEDYDVDFVPHDKAILATIFVINDKGIFGEVKKGEPNQLTQGLYKDDPATSFSYDFKTWHFDNKDSILAKHIKDVVRHLRVTDPARRTIISQELDSAFTHDYLKGYFETSTSVEFGIWFIDYNRLLGDIYSEIGTAGKQTSLVTGRSGSPGKATGSVRIVGPDDVASTKLTERDILVCKMTTPDYVPLMQQAAAIVTDLGGVLSHAAIIARELKKPCITGAKTATLVLQDGQKVTVDADAGTVTGA